MTESVIRGSFTVLQIHPFANGVRHPSVMEVDADYHDPGQYTQIWEVNIPNAFNPGHHQRWYLLPVGAFGPHAYYIYNVGYRKFLTNLQAPTHDLKLYVGEGIVAPNYSFNLTFRADGTVTFANSSLVVTYAGTANGSAINVSYPNGSPNEVFDITATIGFGQTASGNMVGQAAMLIPMHDQGRCVDLAGGNTANDAPMQTWQRMLNNGNQQFALERATSDIPGSFRIRNLHSNKYLQPLNRSIENGVRIVQEPLAVSDNAQLWNLYGGTDGADFVHLINHRSGLAMDVADWGRNNGSALQQWMLHGGENQRFKITTPSV